MHWMKKKKKIKGNKQWQDIQLISNNQRRNNATCNKSFQQPNGEREQTLRKHAYSNILKILPAKNENFQIRNLIFSIFLLKTKIVGTR